MSDIQVIEPAKTYLVTHKKAIREVVRMYTTTEYLQAWDHGLACMDSSSLVIAMNNAWVNAPDIPEVYHIAGFTEMCHLLDQTVMGLYGPEQDFTNAGTSAAAIQEPYHSVETSGKLSKMYPYGLIVPPIPVEWITILNEIKKVLPSAIIAGGAVRDLLMGASNDIRDIDIFVSLSDLQQNDVINSLSCTTLGLFSFQPFKSELINYDLQFTDVYDVWVGRFKHKIVQLIILKSEVNMHSVVERCDFGICRVACDGHTIFIHKDFIHDYSSRVITLHRCMYPISHKRRYLRLSEREHMKGWPLIAPQVTTWEDDMDVAHITAWEESKDTDTDEGL